MSKFTDLTFNFETPSLTTKYTETRIEEKKQRILNELRIKYWKQIYEELENIMRGLVSKSYKSEKSFFNQVRQIKERGVHFFEKLLDLDIPERYNHYLFAQLVMYHTLLLNSEIKFFLNKDEDDSKKYNICIYEPHFTIDNETAERNIFSVLLSNLDITETFIFGEDFGKFKQGRYVREEELLQINNLILSFDWYDDTDSYNPESYFLN